MRNASLLPRISRLSLPIIALFVILTMTVGMFTSVLFEQEHLRRIGRGFYGPDAVFFMFVGDPGDIGSKLMGVLDVEGKTDYLVVNTIEDIRGVYLKGQPETPPMLWGRFLTPEESAGDRPLAVVGDSRWDGVKTSGDSQTIELLGLTCQVVGRMGTKYPSAVNGLVMVNLGSIPQERIAVGRYYVDGEDPAGVFKGLGNNAGSAGLQDPKGMESPREPIDVVAPQMAWGWLYLVLIIGIMLLSSAILMTAWIGRKRYRIAVYRLVGYDGKRICAENLKSYLILAALGIGIGIGLQASLSWLGIYVVKTSFMRQAVAVSGLSLLTGLAITVPALLRAVRVDVIKILR